MSSRMMIDSGDWTRPPPPITTTPQLHSSPEHRSNGRRIDGVGFQKAFSACRCCILELYAAQCKAHRTLYASSKTFAMAWHLAASE